MPQIFTTGLTMMIFLTIFFSFIFFMINFPMMSPPLINKSHSPFLKMTSFQVLW